MFLVACLFSDNPASVQYIVSALVDVSCKDGRDEGQKAVMQGRAVVVVCWTDLALYGRCGAGAVWSDSK